MRTAIVPAVLMLTGIGAGLVIAESASRSIQGPCPLRFKTGVASEMGVEERHDTYGEADGVRITFDADGFRAEGVQTVFDRTVLFIGDSFTLGYGVVDGASFPAQTGRALASRGLNVRVVNAGSSGMGGAQELRLMKRLLGRMKPDLIVLQVFPHNDLADNWEDGGFTVAEGRLVALSPPRPPLHITCGQWLADHNGLMRSNVVRLLANALLIPKPLEATDEGVALERLLLREAVATSRSAGIPIFLLVVGEKNECDSSARFAQGAYDRVLEVVGAIDAPSMSSCTVTRDAADYNRSEHFNATGNELIGAALAERIAPVLRAASVR